MKNFKRLIAACMTAILLISAFAIIPVNAASVKLTVKVAGKTIAFPDQQPVVKNDRTLVPVRFIAENLGYKVEWMQKENGVSIDNGRIKMYFQSKTAYIDGKQVTLDVAPEVIGDRTMVPLRIIAETLNCTVDWIPANAYILINKRNAKGEEMSVFERFRQTDLFWEKTFSDGEIRLYPKSRYTEQQVKSGTNTSWEWMIIKAADMEGMEDAAGYDCTISMDGNLTKDKIAEIKDLLYLLYPTKADDAYDFMMKTMRAEIFECTPALFKYLIPLESGTASTHYLDNREVHMVRDLNCTNFTICVTKEGYKAQMEVAAYTASEIANNKKSMMNWDVLFGNK